MAKTVALSQNLKIYMTKAMIHLVKRNNSRMMMSRISLWPQKETLIQAVMRKRRVAREAETS